MRFEDFVIPKLFDSLGLASNDKLFGEAQVTCLYLINCGRDLAHHHHHQ